MINKKKFQLLLLFVDDIGPYVCTRWVVKKAETAVWEKGCPALPTIKTARKAAKIIWYMTDEVLHAGRIKTVYAKRNPKKNCLEQGFALPEFKKKLFLILIDV